MDILTNTLNLNQEKTIGNNLKIEEKQNKFLNTMLGKAINTGVNLGIRAVLPNFIEDQVIDLKDTLIREGLGQTIKQAINSTIDLGKSIIGIATGHFENLSQARNATKHGGILDTISGGLEFALKTANKKGLVSDKITNLISGGKEIIVDSIKTNKDSEFNNQLGKIENLNNDMKRWNKYYKEKDLDGIRRENINIQRNLKAIFPIENTIQEARKIENLSKIILKNEGNFNLSEEEINLANRLIY